MRRIVLILLLISLLVTLAACGGDDESAEVTPEAGQPTEVVEPAEAPTATSLPPTATPEPPTVTPEPEAAQADEEEAILDAEQLATLENLDSYRSYTLFSYSGTGADGQPVDSSLEVRSEYTREPKARFITMSGTGLADESAPDQVGSMQFYQIDNTIYAQFDGQWIQIGAQDSPLDDPDSEFLTNTGLLFSDLEGLKRVRPDEKTNGIDSRHYAFDESSLSTIFGLTQDAEVTVKGDVWIAKDGGFVTRYVMDAEVKQGGGLLAPDLAEGTLRMEFELSDVNGDLVIEVPEAAASGSSIAGFEDGGFPMPEDATIVMASPEFTMMQSALPVEEVQAFYEQALGALGWAKDEEGSTSFGGFTNLSFKKEGITLSLTISGGEDGTQIMVGVESAP